MEKRKVKVLNKSDNNLPEYSTEFSAGFDIRSDLSRIHKKEDLKGRLEYVSFEINEVGKKVITLFPGGRVLIPTGLHVEIPDGYELQIRPRSGLSIKHGIMIVNSPGTIDSDYRGEINIIIYNSDPVFGFDIYDGDRIAQGVLNVVEQIEWVKVKKLEDLSDTERGQGGFGHTGTK